MRKFHNLVTWEAWDHSASVETGDTTQEDKECNEATGPPSLYQLLSVLSEGPAQPHGQGPQREKDHRGSQGQMASRVGTGS